MNIIKIGAILVYGPLVVMIANDFIPYKTVNNTVNNTIRYIKRGLARCKCRPCVEMRKRGFDPKH